VAGMLVRMLERTIQVMQALDEMQAVRLLIMIVLVWQVVVRQELKD
jgi:hypothetical protein